MKVKLKQISGINLQTITDRGNTTTNDIEITNNQRGIIIKSPDGTRWRISIDNGGHLTVESL